MTLAHLRWWYVRLILDISQGLCEKAFLYGMCIFGKSFSSYGVGVQTENKDIAIRKVENSSTRKIDTRYKGSYINAWYGTFQLKGKRKYLDFLYQTGVGSKNSQGFGMFEII